MKLVKDAILGGFSFLGLPRDRAVILMYHSIDDRPDHFNSVAPDTFARQMSYLSAQKLNVIQLSELVRRLCEKLPLRGSVVITFDDGYRNNLTNALPVLRQQGFPATIFVVTDLIDKTDENGLERLSRQELQALEASGLVDIEPHTKSHPRLSKLDAGAAREEIAGSKVKLEEMLGKKATLFAYPYGDYGETTPRLVRECGYAAAVTVEEGTVRTGVDPFRLPRVSIDKTTSLVQFKAKVSTAIDAYEGFKRAFGL